jgi:8-oxo-dGTP pyrophosphatase MutT (NUDIX family)
MPSLSPLSSPLLDTVPTPADLAAFQEGAERLSRRLVVGALIHDPLGRIFVQRRSESRALFPGCWDLVGGHVEVGETLLDALGREIAEETGWELAAVGRVVMTLDWEAGGVARREIDLLVTVVGDLTRPALEVAKVSEGRWLARGELAALLERREPDDVFVHDVVERAFALLGG